MKHIITIFIIVVLVGCKGRDYKIAEPLRMHIVIPGQFAGKFWGGTISGDNFRIISWTSGKSDTSIKYVSKGGGLMVEIDTITHKVKQDINGHPVTIYKPDSIVIETIEP